MTFQKQVENSICLLLKSLAVFPPVFALQSSTQESFTNLYRKASSPRTNVSQTTTHKYKSLKIPSSGMPMPRAGPPPLLFSGSPDIYYHSCSSVILTNSSAIPDFSASAILTLGSYNSLFRGLFHAFLECSAASLAPDPDSIPSPPLWKNQNCLWTLSSVPCYKIIPKQEPLIKP